MGNSTGSTMYMFGAGNHYLHCRNADLSGIPVDQEKKRTKKR